MSRTGETARTSESHLIEWHRHDNRSLLDGTFEPEDYAKLAAEMGHPALAQTNHATLSGTLHHIEACRKYGILPICGCEVYFRRDRTIRDKSNLPNYHLCLWAKNLRGWHNLMRLTSVAFKENTQGKGLDQGGFYDKPCVDLSLLRHYREGLICSTACISSYFAHLVCSGDSVAAKSHLHELLSIFGSDLVMEIQPHDFDDQRLYNLAVVQIGYENGVPILTTSDAHYLRKKHAKTQQVAKMIGVNKSFKDLQTMIDEGKPVTFIERVDTLYMRDAKDMRESFQAYHPEIPLSVVDRAIDFTDELLERTVPFLLDKSEKFPNVERFLGNAEQVIKRWIKDGFERIERQWREDDGLTEEEIANRLKLYWERHDYEWAILKKKNVLGYFAIVGDVCRWAKSDLPMPTVDAFGRVSFDPDKKKKPIRMGLARGSAAGCLISYLIGITGIDPIPYGFLFERFLNPDRKGMPDIDLDFDSDRRDEVKEYVITIYGRDYVADIITHQTFKPKEVIQSVGRVMDIDWLEISAVTDTINIKADDDETTLLQLVEINEKLKAFSERHPEAWKIMLDLEGSPKNAGKHAAGIIVTPFPIYERMPLERDKEGGYVTAWSDTADFPVVSDYGFLKMDFLGIKGLTKHEYACNLIEERHGETVDLNALPALRDPYGVDPEVMEAFSKGMTIGVFQFGKSGITSLIKKIKPTSIFDLSAANALYRPGPMHGGTTWEFPERKQLSADEITYWHPIVRSILEETYGLIVYQEQVMLIAQALGGLTGGDADMLRKAMGKLYRLPGGEAKRFMAKWYEPFKKFAMEHRDLAEQVVDEIWQMMVSFGSYGFNKSHSGSYACQAYQDMWLKVKYPLEFYASILTYPSGSKPEDKRAFINQVVREARLGGIEIAPPSINESGMGYTIVNDKLQLGFAAINGIGEKVAQQVVRKQPYTDFDDFTAKWPSLSPKQLIESGAMDSILDRAYMLSKVYKRDEPSYIAKFDCGASRTLHKRPVENIKCTKKGHENADCSLEEVEEIRPEWCVWEAIKHNKGLKKPKELPEERREPPLKYLKALEDEMLSVKLNAVTLTPEQAQLVRDNIWTMDEIENEVEDDEEITIGGEVIKVDRKSTKNGDPFANVTIAFELEEWSVKFWSNQLNRFHHLLVPGKYILVKGKKNTWNDRVQIVAGLVIDAHDFADQMAHAA